MFRKSDVRRKSIVSYALSYKKIVVRYLVHRARGLVDQQSVASEVTTLWRYTNLFIISIIIITHNRLKSLTDCPQLSVCLSVCNSTQTQQLMAVGSVRATATCTDAAADDAASMTLSDGVCPRHCTMRYEMLF